MLSISLGDKRQVSKKTEMVVFLESRRLIPQDYIQCMWEVKFPRGNSQSAYRELICFLTILKN